MTDSDMARAFLALAIYFAGLGVLIAGEIRRFRIDGVPVAAMSWLSCAGAFAAAVLALGAAALVATPAGVLR